ncbi:MULTISPECIES: immunoglobulin-like domain-containing protein [Epilithonimonas]|uniref:immunoglobulin-like domain-containing protein n=1 Tax=Epilithonimonas TaxID=2782229 RepID=UPI002896C5FF|nr:MULTISPECIES: immunoglobulin-like domain-containing protein [Epilithonimonas]
MRSLLLLLLTISYGCNKKLNPTNPSVNKYTMNENVLNRSEKTEVVLKISPKIFNYSDSKKEGTYKLINNTENQILYSSDFIIEKFNDEKWLKQALDPKLVFGEINYSLEKKTSKSYPLFLVTFMKDKKLERGRYRIGKRIWPTKNSKDIRYIYDEFLID